MSKSSKEDPKKLSTLFLSFLLEVFFAVVTVYAALIANSVTLWTNAARASLGATLCVLAYFAARRIGSVKNSHFDYGLGKVEHLVSLFGGLVMFATLLIVGFQAGSRFLAPVAPQGTSVGILVLLVTFTLNFWLFRRFQRLRKSGDSPILLSQYLVYRNAVLASGIALAAVALASALPDHESLYYLDPIGAGILCFFLFQTGLTLTRDSIIQLIDAPLEEATQLAIDQQLIRHFSDYEQLHRIRTRRSGPTVFVEVFLSFDPALSIGEVLDRCQRLKRSLEKSISGSEVWIIPTAGSEMSPS